jgi:hypothetical protein
MQINRTRTGTEASIIDDSTFDSDDRSASFVFTFLITNNNSFSWLLFHYSRESQNCYELVMKQHDGMNRYEHSAHECRSPHRFLMTVIVRQPVFPPLFLASDYEE